MDERTPSTRESVSSSSSGVSCWASQAGTSRMSCERPVLNAAETPLEACALSGRRSCRRLARRAVSGSA